MVLEYKLLVPLYPAGDEPPPAGLPEDQIPAWQQQKKMEKYMTMAYESCVFKSVIAGGLGNIKGFDPAAF
jgi:import inner membrane translocase subunit TIM22